MTVVVPLTLPERPTDVPKYAPTGRTETVSAPEGWPGEYPTRLTFFALERVGGHVRFDASALGTEEREQALSAGRGRLRGLVAVPVSYVHQTVNADQGGVLAVIGDVKVHLVSLTPVAADATEGFTIMGVYNGDPDVTNL
ncbi:hypothetical protein [Deinococcus yunweiensis]|uniref:hypothetical protein n=1 Tax=Deinococcus yunweiensis TaxID=367282 RepID=UPI00398F63A4